jgi:hypothetical protein
MPAILGIANSQIYEDREAQRERMSDKQRR